MDYKFRDIYGNPDERSDYGIYDNHDARKRIHIYISINDGS